jgi:hypothetical protein
VQASESDIKKAFQSGDDDADDTLSVSEAVQAIEKLTGKELAESKIESACSSCGVSTNREMDCKWSPLVPAAVWEVCWVIG